LAGLGLAKVWKPPPFGHLGVAEPLAWAMGVVRHSKMVFGVATPQFFFFKKKEKLIFLGIFREELLLKTYMCHTRIYFGKERRT
jgi:hypothetical protein